MSGTNISSANPQGFPQITAPFVDENRQIVPSWLQLLRTLFIRTGASQGAFTIASGTVLPYAGATIPAGFLLCDGNAYKRADFPTLFTAIGVLWGAGDGLTTFNVPNLQGRMLLGANTMHGLGTTGGAETASLAEANLAPHTHVVDDPGHLHSALVASSTNTAGAAAGTAVAGNTGTATTGITLETTGAGQPFNTISPYGAVNYMVKV